MFQYCPYCKVDLCEECVNKFFWTEIDHYRNHLDYCVPVNEKNHKCLEHIKGFSEDFCLDCKVNVCEREKKERHKHHKILNTFKLQAEAQRYINVIIEKNKILSDIIQFNYLILNSYDKFHENYFHIKSLINIGKSFEQENKIDSKQHYNIIFGLEKNRKVMQEMLSRLNNEFLLDFDGNELKLYLGKRKLGDLGFQLVSKLQFTNLKDIDVSENNISNIEPLNNMILPHLEYINMSENRITDVKPIAELNSKKLKKIILRNNKIEDFSPFLKSDFPELEILRIEANNFNKDLYEFKRLIKKYSKQIIYIEKTLDDFNKKYRINIDPFTYNIIDLSDRGGEDLLIRDLYLCVNTNLKIIELSLRKNKITNVQLLSRIPLRSLRRLDLSFNSISNVEFLEEKLFLGLQEMYLNDNLIYNCSQIFRILEPDINGEKKLYLYLKVISLGNNLFKYAEKKILSNFLKAKGIEHDL